MSHVNWDFRLWYDYIAWNAYLNRCKCTVIYWTSKCINANRSLVNGTCNRKLHWCIEGHSKASMLYRTAQLWRQAGALCFITKYSKYSNSLIRFWVQILHKLIVSPLLTVATHRVVQKGLDQIQISKRLGGRRMTFLFDPFKEQVKVYLSFDSLINAYATRAYLHVSSFKKMKAAFCCSSRKNKLWLELEQGQEHFILKKKKEKTLGLRTQAFIFCVNQCFKNVWKIKLINIYCYTISSTQVKLLRWGSANLFLNKVFQVGTRSLSALRNSENWFCLHCTYYSCHIKCSSYFFSPPQSSWFFLLVLGNTSACCPFSSFQMPFIIYIYAPEQDTGEKIAATLAIELPHFCLLL